MKQRMIKTLALLLALLMVGSGLIACSKEDPTPGADSDSSTEAPANESEAAPVDTEGAPIAYDLKSFAIIKGETSGDNGTVSANYVYNSIKNKGIKPERPTADSASEAGEALEILVGKTNRAETTALSGKLTADNQFAVSFQKNKIVILATRDAALLQAAESFVELYLSKAENGVITANENHTYIGTTNLIEVGAAGASHFSVVRSTNASSVAKQVAESIASRIKTRLGAESVKPVDDFEPFDADAKLIIVGNVDEAKYPELTEIKKGWQNYEYGMQIVGNRIYIMGGIDDALNSAAKLFIEALTNRGEIVDGRLLVAFPESLRGVVDGYLVDYPQFTDGTLSNSFVNPNCEIVNTYSGVLASEFDAYVAALTAAGFAPTGAEHTIGVNRFRTLIHEDKGQIHLAYYASRVEGQEGSMQLFANPLSETVAIPQDTYDPTTQKITETTFHVMSMDYEHHEHYEDGNGLSYVVTLEDGRYVVFDGGYTQDALPLYNYLKKHNQSADGKIHIAAWFVSHPHADHYGAIKPFLTNYGSDVEVEYFVANAASLDRIGLSSNWLLDVLPSLLTQTGAKLIKPHPGQVLTFCNTEFEILLTHENLPKAALVSDENNTSTVVRMWENGHSILMTMDASQEASGKMVSLYADALKSDLFQVNHHGYGGGTQDLFEAAGAQYILWTCSQGAFDKRTSGQKYEFMALSAVIPNKWIFDSVGGAENCLVADHIIEQITFGGDTVTVNKATGETIDKNAPTAS